MKTTSPYVVSLSLNSFLVCATVLVAFFGMAAPSPAQVPEMISFQGRLVDGSGPVNGNVSMTLRLFDALNAGNELYSENQNILLIDGLYSFSLGANNASPGSLAAAFAHTNVWLEVEVSGSALSPREQIKSVSYALQALDTSRLAGQAASFYAANSLAQANQNAVVALAADLSTNQTLIAALASDVTTNEAAIVTLQGEVDDLRQQLTSPYDIHGPLIRDSWGLVWDGHERPLMTWSNALAICTAAGGRLPNLTEMERVSATYSAEVGQSYFVNYLWAGNLRANPTSYRILRMSDAGISSNGGQVGCRCVYEDLVEDWFSASACNGPPDVRCYLPAAQPLYAMDAALRAPNNFGGACEECASSHAHLASFLDYVEGIADSFPADAAGSYVWTADAVRYDGNAVIRWTGTNLNISSDGSWANRASLYRFLCKGVNTNVPPHTNTISNEFIATTTYLKSETVDRSAALFADAVSDCFTDGGHLPSFRDWTELIQAGLPNGDNSFLWSGDIAGDSGGSGLAATIRWTGTEPAFDGAFSPFASYGVVNAAINNKYRAVYYPLDPNYSAPATGAGGFPLFSVETGGSDKVKVWMDAIDRTATDFVAACQECAAEGGHLPSVRDYTELTRLGLPNGANQFLFTSDIGADSSGAFFGPMIVKWTGVDTGFSALFGTYLSRSLFSASRPFRCIFTNELR